MRSNLHNEIISDDALSVLKSMPADIVDVGVTSPPYNKKEKNKGWLVNSVHYDSYRDVLPETDYQKSQIEVLNEICRVTKPGGSFFYNHKIRWTNGRLLHPIEWLAKTDWQIRQEIVWNRKIAANIRGWRFWQVEERIYWLQKANPNLPKGKSIDGEIASRHAHLSSIWDIRPERNNPHPAPFPIELPTRAIFSVLDGKKGLVLDPYAGSGTTMLAAKLLGCNYLGIELSLNYVKAAKDRLKNPSSKDVAKFQKEYALHRVGKTFTDRKKNGKHVGRFRSAGGLL